MKVSAIQNCQVLEGLQRTEDDPWVITGRRPGSPRHPWRRIRSRARLDDIRIHDLCHTFASGGLLVGEGLPMIGKLLGHTQVQTKACPQSLPHYVIEKQDLSVSSPVSTDGASIIRQEPPGSRAPLCG